MELNLTLYPEFEGCFDNTTTKSFVGEMEKLPRMLKHLFGYPQLVLSLISLLLNISFTCVGVVGMKSRKLSKRLYLFLINRSVADILSSLETFSLSIYVLVASKPSVAIAMGNDLVMYVAFWSVSVTYVCLSLLKLLAVVKPLVFHKAVTTRRCIYLLALNCVLSVILGFVSMAALSLSTYPAMRDFSGCRYTTCLYYSIVMGVVVQGTFYVAVLGTYVAVCIFLDARIRKRRRETLKGDQKFGRNSDQISMRKLALSIVNYSIFYAIFLAESVYTMTEYNDGCSLILNSYCLFLIIGWVKILFTVRTITDPIISFSTDKKFRDVALATSRLSKVSPRNEKSSRTRVTW